MNVTVKEIFDDKDNKDITIVIENFSESCVSDILFEGIIGKAIPPKELLNKSVIRSSQSLVALQNGIIKYILEV